MPGSPSLASIQTQWDKALVNMEQLRRFGDDYLLAALEEVEKNVEGDFTPQAQVALTSAVRAELSAQVQPSRVLAWHESLLYEYGKFIESPYAELAFVFRDIYDYNRQQGTPILVPSRAITFGTPAAFGTPIGNGFLYRLTKDEYSFDTEACRVETKRVICREDANSGAQRHAEGFEIHGEQPSPDSLDLFNRGTGPLLTTRSKHAGASEGGSLLEDSSFSAFDTTTGTFSGWEVLAGTIEANAAFYRSHPGATADGSMLMNAGASVRQLIETRARVLDPSVPYFLRVMVKFDAPGASGPLTIGIGGSTITIADVSADLTPDANGWAPVILPADARCWFRNFNVEGLAVTIDFSGGTGQLLVDDCTFCEWDLVDGTYLVIVGGSTPWLLDDEYRIPDTQVDRTKGLRNYWTYLAGLGYLPHDNGAGGPAVTWDDPAIPLT